MYELFYYPGNASLAPHFVLEELGVPFALRLVDRTRDAQKEPEYLKRNPMGRIPTLLDGDLVLFEAAAICLHLADRHPHAALAPRVGSDERADLYKWLMFLTNTIQPDFMTFRYPEKYTTDVGGIAAVKASAEARLDAAYAVINDALDRGGPYLLGDVGLGGGLLSVDAGRLEPLAEKSAGESAGDPPVRRSRCDTACRATRRGD